MSDGKVIGVLGLAHDVQSNKTFGEQDSEYLGQFAQLATLAIQNASLLAAAQQELVWRKRAEEERETLIRELEIKNAELERFTYTVSHDLKSPLITINGFLSLLEQDAVAGNVERVKVDVSRISDATDKMQQLLEELLELSRIGRLINPPVDVELGELAREAVEMVAGRLAERDARMIIAPDLPVVYGDYSRLREVLENLIDNAVKFMGDQPDPLVEIGARREDQEIVVHVRDNGTGIDPRYHDKVFELFEKLDQKSKGTGVGRSSSSASSRSTAGASGSNLRALDMAAHSALLCQDARCET
ncbi:MAG: hypothetical protein GY832_08495 [Chloroflexi bacterium]|nr:hypothetical protein [Chloroflexota bacterium]